jgi:hypothetical protein
MRNQDGIVLPKENRSDLFNMIAESLWLDLLPTAFSAAKQSAYSNIAIQLANTSAAKVSYQGIEVSQAFSQRYGTFGCSRIEIPRNAIERGCARLLEHEMLLRVTAIGPDPSVHAKVRTDVGSQRLKLDDVIRDFGDDWKTEIDAAVGAVTREKLEKPADIARMEGQMPGVRTALLGAEAGPDRGSAGALIENKTPAVSRLLASRVGTAVAARCRDYLTQPDPAAQPGAPDESRVIEMLRVIRDRLRNAGQDAAQPVLAAQAAIGLASILRDQGYFDLLEKELAKISTDAAEETKKAQGEVAERQKRVKVALNDLKTAASSFAAKVLGVHAAVVRTLLDRVDEEWKQELKARAYLVLLQCAGNAAAAARRVLEDHRDPLRKFFAAAAAGAEKCGAEAESLLRERKPLLWQEIIDDKLLKECYKLEGGLVKPGKEWSIAWGALGVNPPSWQGIAASLGGHCLERVQTDFKTHPRPMDVLASPRLADSPLQAAAARQLVHQALPALITGDFLQANQVVPALGVYVGIHNPRDPSCVDFIRLLTQELAAVGAPQCLATGDPSCISLYVIRYAFPLPTIATVKSDCGPKYAQFYRELRAGSRKVQGGAKEEVYYSEIPLHMAREFEGQLPGLEEFTDDQARRHVEARRALLFGAVLNVLKAEWKNERVWYSYRRQDVAVQQTVPLGYHREAVDALAGDADLCGQINTEVASRESQLTPGQLEQYYWILEFLQLIQFRAGTPERVIAGRRIADTVKKMLKDANIAPAAVDQADLKAYLAKLSAVDVSGPLPALVLPAWNRP